MVFKDKLVIAKEGFIYKLKNVDGKDILELLNNDNILENLYLVVSENNDLILNDLFKMLKNYPNLLKLSSNFNLIMNEYDNINENDEIMYNPEIEGLLIEKHIVKYDDSLEIFKGITTVNSENPDHMYSLYFEYLKDIINYDINIGNIIWVNNGEAVHYDYYDITLAELIGIIVLDFSYAGGVENKKVIRDEALKMLENPQEKVGFKLVKR